MKPTRALTPDRVARFWDKVNRSDPSGCWVWVGAINKSGYGVFRVAGTGSSPAQAYRVSYELAGRSIPAGYHVDHLCRNRACVNPAHLEAVPARVNTLRGVGPTAANAIRTHCKRGHEFTPENTIVHPLGRNCRTCRRIADRARKERAASEGRPTTPGQIR